MNEALEEYLVKHLPTVCNYAIVYTSKTSVKLVPVANKEELVMLKLQDKVHSTYDYNELVRICRRDFLRQGIDKLKYTGQHITDPLDDLIRQIEFGLVLDNMPDPLRNQYVTATIPKTRPVDRVTTYGMCAGVDAIFEATYGTKAPRVDEDSGDDSGDDSEE